MSNVYNAAEPNARVDLGSALQVIYTAAQMGLASTIAASSLIVSQAMLSVGWKLFAFSVTSTQAGSVSIQRYLDTASTIKQGAALTATLTANSQALINITDNFPFQNFIVTVSNTAGTTATLSNVILLMQSE